MTKSEVLKEVNSIKADLLSKKINGFEAMDGLTLLSYDCSYCFTALYNCFMSSYNQDLYL